MKHRLTFRAYPTGDQAIQLAQTFGCVRFVWNWALRLKSESFSIDKQKIGYAETDRRLTQLKKRPQTIWLQDVSCVPLQQSLRDLQTAFANFFDKRASYPAFKKKSLRQSANYTKNAFTLDRANRILSFAKIGTLKIRWTRDDIPMPSSVRIVKTTTGKYFVSMVVDVEPIQWPKSNASVGLDFGLVHLATLSTGEKIENIRLAEQEQKRLSMLQRRLAKKQKGSRRRVRARHRIAILHERIRNARMDALHKLSTNLVKRFDMIYMEDLNVRGMTKNHRLARVLSDAAIGLAGRLIESKAERYGKTVVHIDRFYPSSKTCSACGQRIETLSLSVREWTCVACGTGHDRDVNAAKNILAVGQTVSAHGAGRRTRRGQPQRATRRRSANHSR